MKILLVEDEPSIADAVEYVLYQEGYQVMIAPLLHNARELYKNHSFDFIILDVQLPDGNGFNFCKELRETSDIPILFLTSRRDEIDRVLGIEIGGDDYLTKPFSTRELTARVKAIFKRTTKNNEVKPEVKEIEIGNFIIDLMQMKITEGNHTIELTKNEFELLKFLLQHPQQVFSREQLMQAVWDVPDSAQVRTVDSHIKSIRKKIANPFTIATHRGFGYSYSQT